LWLDCSVQNKKIQQLIWHLRYTNTQVNTLSHLSHYEDLINKSKRSARRPHYEQLSKIISTNIKNPELGSIFTGLANKGEKSAFLDILASTNPEKTANFLCHLSPASLSLIDFDITFPQLCDIVQEVIKQKPILLTPARRKLSLFLF
jgi:hypothetical protein